MFLWLKFEPGILEACIYILKRAFSQKKTQDMGDPVSVTKKVASIVSIAVWVFSSPQLLGSQGEFVVYHCTDVHRHPLSTLLTYLFH